MGIEIIKDKVKFTFKADTIIDSVSVAGTFNHWDSSVNYFSRVDNYTWEISLDIDDGRHFYLFIINNKEWIIDKDNSDSSEDGQGNSSFTKYNNRIIYRSGVCKNNPGLLWKNTTALKRPEWVKECIIYELNIRQFSKSGFCGMKEKLLYLMELGINTLWIMPIFEIGIKDRIGKYGDLYAVKDFYKINKEYGTDEQFKEFIEYAHQNGFKVIIDWTMNRMSTDAEPSLFHPEWFTKNNKGELYYKIPGRDTFIGINFESDEVKSYIINALEYWVKEYCIDGFRFDDTDITPLSFLNEVRRRLDIVKKDLIIISQAYDELHHLEFCDFTYDGGMRQVIIDISKGKKNKYDFETEYEKMKYSFPKNSLRMRWLEEKEQGRLNKLVNYQSLYTSAVIHLTLDDVPFILMGQEFNDTNWTDYSSLFGEFELDWDNFDKNLFNHYKQLISIRKSNKAFSAGVVKFVKNSDDRVISYKRAYEDDSFLVICNMDKNEKVIQIFIDDDISKYSLVFGEKNEVNLRNIIKLNGYQSLILKY